MIRPQAQILRALRDRGQQSLINFIEHHVDALYRQKLVALVPGHDDPVIQITAAGLAAVGPPRPGGNRWTPAEARAMAAIGTKRSAETAAVRPGRRLCGVCGRIVDAAKRMRSRCRCPGAEALPVREERRSA